MPDTATEPTTLTQRELAKRLRAAIDRVRDSVTAAEWRAASALLAALLEQASLAAVDTVYVRNQLGERVEWLARWKDARAPTSRSNGAGSDVDGRDLEVDRG